MGRLRMIRVCNRHPESNRFCIDHGGRIIVNLNLMWNGRACVDAAMVRTMVTEQRGPFFLHGPGNTNLTPCILAMGYPMSDRERRDIDDWLFRMLMRKHRYYARQMFPWIILLVVCILGVLVIFVVAVVKNRRACTHRS